MPGRDDTFGYNATVAIGEHVVDRLVGSAFDERADSFAIPASDLLQGLAVSGSLHCWIRYRPHIDFDMEDRPESVDTRRNVSLVFNSIYGRFLDAPPVVTSQFGCEEFEASLVVYCFLDRVRGEEGDINSIGIYIDSSSNHISDHDIVVDVSFPVENRDEVESQLRGALLQLFQDQDRLRQVLGELSIPLSLDYEELRSTDDTDATIDYDVTVLDNPGPQLWDTLDEANITLGAWESLGGAVHDESRGSVDDISDTLDTGRSFAIRLSQNCADRLIGTALDTRYMRFSVNVPDMEVGGPSVDVEKQGQTLTFTQIDGYRVQISGGECNAHADLTGTITNTTVEGNHRVRFSTNGKGEFEEIEVEATANQELLFHGDYMNVSQEIIASWTWRFEARQPTLSLMDDALFISGVLEHHVGDLNYEFDYADVLFLTIDPAIEEITVRAEMPYAHFPGALLMEVLVAFFGPVLGFFAYCFGGHALATDELERALRPEIEGAIGGSMESILPSIQEAQSYQAFFEDINLRSDSITLSGQMESGRIALGGVGQRLIRPNLDSVEIDDSDSERMTFQILNFSGLLAVACRLESEPISEPPSLWRITGGDHLFEMTDMDSLVAGSRREERSHVTWGNGITSVLGLPGSELDLSGHTIFGVRTPGGACTKIRLMSTLDDNIAIRWVTYAPPPEPLVEIDGSWRPIDNTWPFRNRHYLGFFRINFDPVDGRGERIHNPATFEGRPYLWWTLSTHGRALAGGRRPSSTDRIAPPTPPAIPATTLSNTEVPPDDWNRVQIYTTPSNLPNELLEVDGSFRFVLQVSVEDIFGRRARTTRDLTGNRLRS